MRIKELIISEIEKKEKIDIGNFIELCQYGINGYYTKNNPIGQKNDFITAPEISQMFGEILGVYLINFWQKNIKTNFNLIELGPGSGTLLIDILRTGKINKNFLNAANIILIEKNKTLIKQQKINLENSNINKVNWFNNFNIKNKKPLIIFSNEFFDCFPIRQFYKKNIWYEKFVKYNKSQKIFSFFSEKVKNAKLLSKLKRFDISGIAEISNSRKKYFESICKLLKSSKGIFITIDYGYQIPPKQFTLQTISKHKKTHLLENIGNQDITAHVDFDELINIAKKNELKIDLFCNQRNFLIDFGLYERKRVLQKNKNKIISKKIELDYDRLINKYQMGEIFKVLIISCL